MIRKSLTFVTLFVLIASCTPSQTIESTSIPPSTSIATPAPTVTPEPSSTPTMMPSPMPTPLRGPVIAIDTADHVKEVTKWGRGMITDAAYSPDGKTIVVGSTLGVYLFDAESLEETKYFSTEFPARFVGYSPDERYIAAVSESQLLNWDVSVDPIRVVKLWNSSDGSLAYTFEGKCFAFSPDSKLLATCSNELKIWDLSDGSLVSTYTGHTEGVDRIIFAPDGLSIFSYSGQVLQHSLVSDGSLINSVFSGSNNWIGAMDLSSDGKILAITFEDKIHLFNTETNEEISTIEDVIDGRPLLFYYYDKDAGKVANSVSTRNLENDIVGPNLVFSPDNQFIATTIYDAISVVWDVSTGKPVQVFGEIETFYPRSFYVIPKGTYINFSSDGKKILQAHGKYLRVLDATSGILLMEKELFSLSSYDIAFTPDEAFLVSVDGDQSINFQHYLAEYKLAAFKIDGLMDPIIGGQPVNIRQFPNGEVVSKNKITSNAENVAAFPNKQLFAIASDKIALWTMDDEVLSDSLSEFKFTRRLEISPDGNLLAFDTHSSRIANLALVNIINGERVFEVGTGFDGVSDIGFSPDNQFIAVAGQKVKKFGFFGWDYSGIVNVYKTNDGESQKIHFPGAHLAFSPDGHYLATTDNNVLYLWKMPEWELVYKDDTHPTFINKVIFSPDGSLLISGTLDGQIWIRDAISGKLITTLAGHTKQINDLLFSRDGSLLISSSEDGTIRIWSVRL
jgi:WD40 repeat protein